MAENLKTTKYCDNSDIPLIEDKTVWEGLTTPGYCWFNNDATANKDTYGALYNWYAVNTGNLCPTGWHVSTIDDWTVLKDYLGYYYVAGGKLKESGFAHWNSPNTSATNESGFTALPAPCRWLGEGVSNIGEFGYWWNFAESNTSTAWVQSMSCRQSNVKMNYFTKSHGFSVRCLRD